MSYRSKSQRMKGAIKAAARSWSPFTTIPITDEMKNQHPHLRTAYAVYANSRYQAECFNCASDIGGVVQVVVRRHLPGMDPIPWDDLQRVVHDIYGANVCAVEVYPPLDMSWGINREVRVLWVLPEGYVPPFGFHLPTAWGRTGEA
jgi:hypothetical protein